MDIGCMIYIYIRHSIVLCPRTKKTDNTEETERKR